LRNNQYKHGHLPSDIKKRLAASDSQGSHQVILVLGIANLLADGFSMAAGNYSATKSDLEKIDYLTDVEKNHIMRYPGGEEEELRQILIRYGYRDDNLETAVNTIKTSPLLWIDLMLQGEYGTSSVRPEPIGAALVTFASFILCGSVPLLPFLLHMQNAMIVAGLATMVVFFLVGAWKTRWTNRNWWRSGFETLVIGASAAAIAFGCGHLLSSIAG